MSDRQPGRATLLYNYTGRVENYKCRMCSSSTSRVVVVVADPALDSIDRADGQADEGKGL